MPKQETLRAKLEAIRVELGLSHSALAKQVGVNWKTYQRILQGSGLTRKATEQKVRSFTQKLGASASPKKPAVPKAKPQPKVEAGFSKADLEFVLEIMSVTGKERLTLEKIQTLIALKK